MLTHILNHLDKIWPARRASAHCDGPCGIYDPASARITAEAVRSMTVKILDLTPPATGDVAGQVAYHNTLSRYIAIKEEQAEQTKCELLILWTDYFKPPHLQQFPNLHDIFWRAAKLCSTCKVEVNVQHADELVETVQHIHDIFWRTKEREIDWYLAG